MSEAAGKIAQGVFAVSKPPQLSSAQVLRDLQSHFRPSALFASLLRRQQQQGPQARDRSGWKQRHTAKNLKIGHGGTLDPLATGVLVVGVGKGTKQMNGFLGCTKSYETVILFGKSTDTYDVAGKTIASAPYEHITRDLVEQKLASFRGKIKQVPPIYSALKIDGMKAYDYARTGKELPRELEARDMEVAECELVEWFEGKTHDYRWPATEAPVPVRELAMEMAAAVQGEPISTGKSQKRKVSASSDEEKVDCSHGGEKQQKVQACASDNNGDPGPVPLPKSEHELQPLRTSKTSSALGKRGHKGLSAEEKAKLHTHEIGPLSSEICPAPAARIRVSVSSGFYVRSFAHDLGIACGSLALMANLIRSRQGEFESSSALRYEELDEGEGIWGPKVEKMLDRWNEQHPEPEEPLTDDSGRPGGSKNRPWEGRGGQGPGRERRVRNHGMKSNQYRDRRNTSSGEE